MTGSSDFEAYALNLSRIAVMGLIEELTFNRRKKNIRASLVVNPVTQIPYGYNGEKAVQEISDAVVSDA